MSAAPGIARPAPRLASLARLLRRQGNLVAGSLLLVLFLAVIVLAPVLGTSDPQAMVTAHRLRPPSAQYWFGTDRLGRDIYSRAVYGTSASLSVGAAVALFGCLVGTLVGLLAGYFRRVDGLLMRLMDAVMAVPGIMIAIAVISVFGASITTVVLAIGVYEVPRIARLVRGVMLSVREEPYVEAAIVLGSPAWFVVLRHMLPNVAAPLAVLSTHVAASAMLLEATLSFLGCGLPPDVPTWGNIMADGRILFRIAPWIILFPGLTLAIAVFAINLFGDGLRDLLDPRLTTSGH